ncbi:MAG TPA: hypothetical protein VEL77_08265 [Rugosimonospora sp.]|nr:hypothetical protein [Rugosimonospora sp.]
MWQVIPEPMNCFVTLANGSKKEFPRATEVREREDGIDIYDDCIHLGAYKRGEFRVYWIDPIVAAKRQDALGRGKKSRSRHPRD